MERRDQIKSNWICEENKNKLNMDTIENIKTGMRSVKRNERTREKHRGVGGDMSERNEEYGRRKKEKRKKERICKGI